MNKEILELVEKVKAGKASQEEVLIVVKELNFQIENFNNLLKEILKKV